MAAGMDDEGEGEDEEEQPPQQMLQDQDIGQEMVEQDQQDPIGEEQDQPADEDQIELTDEQLLQLIQNVHNLSPDQQLQLQMILQQKMKTEMA